MKIILVILILVTGLQAGLASSQNTALRRSNRLLRFIVNSPLLRTFALETIINTRCQRYLSGDEKSLCSKAVKRELQLLDFDILLTNPQRPRILNPQSYVFVAFKKNLINLLSDSHTTIYLQDLQLKLNDYLLTRNADLNIWEITLSHFKTPTKSAMVLAALFQDTSNFKLHLSYLDRNGPTDRQNLLQNKELLSRAIDTVNLILDYSEDNFSTLFYPKTLGLNLNRNIYHFYVPLYLAMQLRSEGFSQRAAYLAPLMMTLSYEFLTTASDARYVLKDPPQLDAFEGMGKLKDIFGGHTGAVFGVGRKNEVDFNTFTESFSRSTREAVNLLINHSN